MVLLTSADDDKSSNIQTISFILFLSFVHPLFRTIEYIVCVNGGRRVPEYERVSDIQPYCNIKNKIQNVRKLQQLQLFYSLQNVYIWSRSDLERSNNFLHIVYINETLQI